jgi:hypothetical protein
VVKRETWTPDPAIHDYFPEDVSRNVVNGVGERAPRRPSPIFWHRPDKEAFGKLQEHVVAAFQLGGYLPRRLRARRPSEEARSGRCGPRRPAGRGVDPDRQVRARERADLVGIARVDPQWIFEGYGWPIRS